MRRYLAASLREPVHAQVAEVRVVLLEASGDFEQLTRRQQLSPNLPGDLSLSS